MADYRDTPVQIRVRDRAGARYDVMAYGLKGDGVTDDATALNTLISTVLSAGGGTIFFPPGTYVLAANVVVSVTGFEPVRSLTLEGVPYSSVLKPSAAVTTCLTLAGESNVDGVNNRVSVRGLRLDGVNTTGATGILVGSNAANLSSYITLEDVEVYRFRSAGGKGIHIKDVVGPQLTNVYAGRSYVNLFVEGSDPELPTVLACYHCQFREAQTKNIRIEHGNRLRFLGCVNEAALEEGLYIVPSVVRNVLDFEWDGGWFEGNNPGAANYQIRIDGTNAGTIMPSLRNINFTGTARAVYLKTAYNVVLDNLRPQPAANQIVVDTGCTGMMVSWPENNAPLATVLTNNSGSTFNTFLPRIFNKIWLDAADHLSPTSQFVHGLGDATFRFAGVWCQRIVPYYAQPTYGTTVAINAAQGNFQQIYATNGTAFTIANPTNAAVGQFLTIQVKNTSGGALGTITWGSAYRLAGWTNPANGFSRAATFVYDGDSWDQVSRTPEDVPN